MLASEFICLFSFFFRLPHSHFRILSLVPKPILVPAIRALPGDGVAGHAPYVFMHAFLADIETTATAPAKPKFLAAAVAPIIAVLAMLAPVTGGWCGLFHGCCFTI